MRKEIIFTGSGGQGVITASIVLAEAAAIHEGLYAVQSQVYGPEARGGSSSAHVILSDEPVGYPKVAQPQLMAALTQESFDKFNLVLRPGGVLLTDAFYVRRPKVVDGRIYVLPMYEAVQEKLKLPIAFNVCAIGALVGLSGVVKPESVRETLRDRIAPRFIDKNLAAFDLGFELATQAKPWAGVSNQKPIK